MLFWFFFHILTDEQTDNNQSDACQFAPRQMFIEDEKHRYSGESGTDIVKDIRPRNTDLTHRIAK